MNLNKNRDVVIVRAGRSSTHGEWTLNGRKTFDLYVVAYEELPDNLMRVADNFLHVPGRKVAGWNAVLQLDPGLLGRYDQYAFIDDDIICNAADIQRTFAAGRDNRLALWQPSLTWASYFSYGATLHNPLFRLRYVNFVEMMCPFFSQEQLARAAPLFGLGLETGIDRIWCRLNPRSSKAYAIIDDVSVMHSRPVASNATLQGFRDSKNPYQDALDEIDSQLGISFEGPVSYAGVLRSGRAIEGKVRMALCSVVPLLGWRQQVNKGWFVRPVIDHTRHILSRPINNGMIDMSEILKRTPLTQT